MKLDVIKLPKELQDAISGLKPYKTTRKVEKPPKVATRELPNGDVIEIPHRTVIEYDIEEIEVTQGSVNIALIIRNGEIVAGTASVVDYGIKGDDGVKKVELV